MNKLRALRSFFGRAQPLRLPTADEQHVLAQLRVRLGTDPERPRWNAAVAPPSLLKNATLVGEHLCYVAEYQGPWLALLGWSAPARHRRPREAWIGWAHEPLARRRHWLANNARFCILAERAQLPHLAPRALALSAPPGSRGDWPARWGHPLVAVESFVDGQLFRATADQAAGWTRLDDTRGSARVAEGFYERHDRPKQLGVRALEDQAFRARRAPSLPPALAAFEKEPPPHSAHAAVRRPAARGRTWINCPPRGPIRAAPRAAGLPWRAVWGVIVLAKLCGVRMGQRQIAEFARGLTQPQRRALRCRREPEDPAQYGVPAESTFQRALAAVDPRRLEPLGLPWPPQQRGPPTDDLIALDGKSLRRSGGLASARGQPSQRVPATLTLGPHDSEIIAVRQLLARTEFTGPLLALDSLPTQHATIHPILDDHGADCLVPLKDNQPTMLATAPTLLPENVSPSGGAGPPALSRQRPG